MESAKGRGGNMPGNIGARRCVSPERFHLASEKWGQRDIRAIVSGYHQSFRARLNSIGIYALINDKDDLKTRFQL